MADLLLKPKKVTPGEPVQAVTPKSANWTYVGFEVVDLAPGQSLARETRDMEVCLVLVGGRARIVGAGQDFGVIGERINPFDGLPWSVYVPAKSDWTVTAEGPVELAICAAPAEGKLPPRLITPDEVGEIDRGAGTNLRRVRNILPETKPAESLLVVEVITPGGNWSSYPPHKHDRDAIPAESYLEETYYHRIRPPQGYAIQRVYTDDRSLDETCVIGDRDVVLVPKGYHPVGAAHGYDLYYLNVMAGPTRTWRFYNEPAHEWLFKPVA